MGDKAHLGDERIRLEQKGERLADTTYKVISILFASGESSAVPAAPRTTTLTIVIVCSEVREGGGGGSGGDARRKSGF